jgi:hypothetical protein
MSERGIVAVRPSRLDRFAIEHLRMRRLAFACWSPPPNGQTPNPLMLRCSGAKRPSLEARTVRLRRKS